MSDWHHATLCEECLAANEVQLAKCANCAEWACQHLVSFRRTRRGNVALWLCEDEDQCTVNDLGGHD